MSRNTLLIRGGVVNEKVSVFVFVDDDDDDEEDADVETTGEEISERRLASTALTSCMRSSSEVIVVDDVNIDGCTQVQ